ncbi:peptidoglycan DD-metalloendopeptidase family protein [Colwellia sp. 1_MG-2023]|uniref:peptidoglycan DD-metalloendopeptidase family protein n=1 Tax=Colwellia sp. 1_MG-2023 TaxID=3062649 RepID=UPI0026E46017|nr:peptidoglycan DD-metalloendopeptidase family protein [Colwellia sp. 1_MG-2023]MDO6447369.1 peptidoglycan DD-metalloendopeptidase family protein [Colwellia sp. 1_MG-2023]
MNNLKKLYIQLPKQHRIFISVVSVLLLLLVIFPSEKATASRQSEQSSLKVGQRYELSVPEQVVNAATTSTQQGQSESDEINIEEPQLTWQTAKVKSGDSLAKIFKRFGYNARTTHDVSQAKGEDSHLLKKLNVGDTLRIGKDSQGKLSALEYPLSKTDTLFVNLVDGQYQSFKESKTVEIRESIAHGVIKSNFWNAGIAAGLDDGQIINLANIFGWDIDFALDIRKGDSFHVVYENKYVDGEFIGNGKILAAEFINQDDPFQAIRFTDGEYYSPDGKSMRKAFLRAPVNFKYISSNFKPKRFHPIQKRWKAHRGTDYRANKGTPVVAAGNGKVTHSTYNKYNGNYVFIQHGNGIVTKYLHFSKRAVKKGQRVKQGQIIGYVGSTGMSQAPHLHYEFLLNGVHRNPRTVKLPDAKPIDKKYRQAFAAIADRRLTELSGSRIALTTLNTQKNVHQQAP